QRATQTQLLHRNFRRDGGEEAAEIAIGVGHSGFHHDPIIKRGYLHRIRLTPAPRLDMAIGEAQGPSVIMTGGRKTDPGPKRPAEHREAVRRVDAEGALLNA